MVTSGTQILASDYNSIRTTANTILVSSWGQSMISSNVTSNVDTVDAAQLEELWIDLQRIYNHQIGSLTPDIAVPATGYTIGADTSFAFNQSTGALSAVTNGTRMGFNDYSAVGTDVANFDPDPIGWPASSFSPGTAENSVRTTTWGGAGQNQAVYHVMTVTFPSVTQKNYYLNAGGEIRFSAVITGGSGAKTLDWNAMFSSMGTLKMNAFSFVAASGTSANLGLNDLTASYQTLFTKTGSGVYADNDYTIEGRAVSTTQYRFRITFNDGDSGTGDPAEPDTTPIDESVNGTLTSTVQPGFPDSNFTYNTVSYGVNVSEPTLATAIDVSGNFATPPT